MEPRINQRQCFDRLETLCSSARTTTRVEQVNAKGQDTVMEIEEHAFVAHSMMQRLEMLSMLTQQSQWLLCYYRVRDM